MKGPYKPTLKDVLLAYLKANHPVIGVDKGVRQVPISVKK